jgi:hypothetical protein
MGGIAWSGMEAWNAMVNGNGSGSGSGSGPWPVIQHGGRKKQMRNNQPNKGSNEAAATRANNQPNNSMEAWSRSAMVKGNGNGSWSTFQRLREAELPLLEFDFMSYRMERMELFVPWNPDRYGAGSNRTG